MRFVKSRGAKLRAMFTQSRPNSPVMRRCSSRTAASALALLLGLTGCGGAGAPPPAASSTAQTNAMLLKIADESDAGGDPATAASLYRRLHDASPKDPIPLARLGRSLLRAGDDHAAAEAYRAAIALDPDNPDLHRGLALSLLLVGDIDAALAEIRGGLQRQADDPRIYSLLGVAQDMTGRHDLAQQTYRHGLEIAPANPGLRNNLAISLALAGDYASAISELQGIGGPEAAPRYRLNLALAYGLAGDEAKAAATAREVLDERSVESNLANYALLRGMDERQRTAAIFGSELHGTALALGTTPSAAPPKPALAQAVTPPPAPIAVATTSIPPLPAPPASAAVPSPPPVAAAPAPPAASSAPAIRTEGAAHPLSPQSRATAAEDSVERQISDFLSTHLPDAPSTQAAAEADAIQSFLAGHVPVPAAPAANPVIVKPQSFLAPAVAEPQQMAELAEITVTASRLAETDAATPLSDQRYAVQLGSFLAETGAQRLADAYMARNVAVTISRLNDRDGRQWFVVRAGEFQSADDAHALLQSLGPADSGQAIVVRYRVPSETRA